MRRSVIIIALAAVCGVALAFDAALLLPFTMVKPATGIFVWQTGHTGAWLTATNWTPAGFANRSDQECTINSGIARTDSTAFQPKLRIEGVNGVGGTLSLLENSTVSNGVVLAGGELFLSGTSRTLNGTVEALAGTTSQIQVDGSTSVGMGLSGALIGTGTLLVGGVGFWSQGSTTATGFNGRIDITDGRLVLRSGTLSYGDSGQIYVNGGGVLSQPSSAATWTMRGGVTLNGGKYFDDGNNGTTWSADTPWTVVTNSTIETASTGGFADILGPLHGSGALRIQRAEGSALRGVTLRGTNSTYSGTITVAATPTNAFLYFGNSTAMPTNGSLASLVVEQSGGTNAVVTVGARRGTAVTDVPNVKIKVRALTVGGSAVAAGTYDISNAVPTAGYVVFNNATSSLQVTE